MKPPAPLGSVGAKEKYCSTVAVAASEGLAAFQEDAVNRLKEDEWVSWLRLIVETCTHPALLGTAAHLLYVGRKRDNARDAGPRSGP